MNTRRAFTYRVVQPQWQVLQNRARNKQPDVYPVDMLNQLPRPTAARCVWSRLIATPNQHAYRNIDISLRNSISVVAIGGLGKLCECLRRVPGRGLVCQFLLTSLLPCQEAQRPTLLIAFLRKNDWEQTGSKQRQVQETLVEWGSEGKQRVPRA